MRLREDAVERVANVFADAELGDPRRVQRVMHTVRRLAAAPDVSFPRAMGNEADVEGAYRLLNSTHVSSRPLADAYGRSTAERARDVGTVLAIHDTTTCEFPHADPEHVGYLPTGAGFLAHYTLIVGADASQRPLGVTYVEALARPRPPKKPKGAPRRKKSGTETHGNPERESLRWNRGIEATSELLRGIDVLHVADREGDNFELFAEAIARGARFVIRARVGARRARAANEEMSTLRDVADQARGKLLREVDLSIRHPSPEPRARKAHAPREARTATLIFAATSVVLVRPRYSDVGVSELALNLVRVYEEAPPAGEKPVEWLLFTTEPVRTAEEVERVVDAYRARWLIEECNKAIKTGCKFEERHFESFEALVTLFVMTLPIACELLALRAACRRNPDYPARNVLTATQLRVLRQVSHRKLSEEPTVYEALWAVAGLGGHLRTNGEPGWKVLQGGMTQLLAYEAGWLARERADF